MRGETPLRSNQNLFVAKRSRARRKLKRRPLIQSSELSVCAWEFALCVVLEELASCALYRAFTICAP
ncbi:hypothetical protein WN944_019286 [Citrus x changshan-huyou]|uniref:Uncharacterized protein n=1 Tax=Citrus x changshan-huyou TaxID=2935761 RepID=A0AAP0LXV9_9ROSI